LPDVPPHGELVAHLEFQPTSDTWEQEAEIYLEDITGMRTIKIIVKINNGEGGHDSEESP
jgi:hypothetical protein